MVVELWALVFGYTEARNDPARVLQAKLAWDAASHRATPLLLVADEGRRVIGTIMLGYDGHRGWLYRLAVLPEARRRGVGRALVEAAERRLLELECAKINLQLHTHNEDGVRFWRALGYAEEARVSMGKDLRDDSGREGDAGC
jgi:ribosomal protein S18 acetylase RimI-like enzyme